MSIRQGNKIIAGVLENLPHNIGEIFPAPFTDTWTPKGAVPCNGAEYTRDKFPQFFDEWLGKEVAGLKKWYAWKGPNTGIIYTDIYVENEYNHYNKTAYKFENGKMVSTGQRYKDFEVFEDAGLPRSPVDDKDLPDESTITISGGRVVTITYEQFANEIATKGFCDAYAINGNSFKVPQIPNGLTLGVEALAGVRGNGVALGLTNGVYDLGLTSANGTYMTVFGGKPDAVNHPVGQGGAGANGITGDSFYGIIPDSRKSGMVAEPKAKNAERLGWFCQIANGEINQSDIDWAQWQSDLQGKADKDLSNVTPNQSFKRDVLDYSSMDTLRAIKVAIPFTAPTSGHIILQTNNGGEWWINDLQIYYTPNNTLLPIRIGTGDTISNHNGSVVVNNIKFIPDKGAN